MTARFSFNSLEDPQTSAPAREPIPESVVCSMPLQIDCDVLMTSVLDEDAPAGIATIDGDEVFVPENYEPNYAYPLLVWLFPACGSNGRLERLMRMISERNYFGVAIPVVDSEQLEQQLQETFSRLRQSYHLHSERVYLMGIGESGTQALQTGLSRPALFGGIAAVSARWPETPRLLARFDELRGKRVLLGINEHDSAAIVADVMYAQQLLWSAGMNVSALASSADAEPHRSLLREVDRWVMQAIERPELVC